MEHLIDRIELGQMLFYTRVSDQNRRIFLDEPLFLQELEKDFDRGYLPGQGRLLQITVNLCNVSPYDFLVDRVRLAPVEKSKELLYVPLIGPLRVEGNVLFGRQIAIEIL